MAKPWAQYTKEMQQNFGYFATWTPGTPLVLGDVGVIRENVFTRVTSLEQEGIAFQERPDTSREDMKHSSSGNVSFAFKAAGKVPEAGSALAEAEAGVTIEFTRDKAVVFEAAGCRAPSIENLKLLGKEVVRRYRTGSWERDWVVVTEVVTAETGSVLISERRGAKIEISVGGKVQGAGFGLADASLGLSIVSQRDMMTTLVGQQGLTPLFRAWGVKSDIPMTLRHATRGIRATQIRSPREAVASGLVSFAEVAFEWTEEE